MKITLEPTPAGWQAADADTLDAEIDFDGHSWFSGMYAHGNTQRKALLNLRDMYRDCSDDSDHLETQLKCSLAMVEIDKYLEGLK